MHRILSAVVALFAISTAPDAQTPVCTPVAVLARADDEGPTAPIWNGSIPSFQRFLRHRGRLHR
jgi:hypothetical protein